MFERMRRRQIAGLAVVLLTVAVACGSSITEGAKDTLSTALTATNAARDAFVRWDEAHQLGLVERATSREEGEAQLRSYRRARERVLKAFTAAYAALAAASALLPLVQHGERKETALVVLVVDAVEAAKEVKAAIAAVRGSP
jgi:hypothetical protein